MDQSAVIVEPDLQFRLALTRLATDSGWEALSYGTFEEARKDIGLRAPSIVVTTIRVGLFNGIHLAYIAKLTNPRAKSVVYGTGDDLHLAREAQRAGAFYERRHFMAHALPQYLTAMLPTQDRRDAASVDRRLTFRGGRRATDVAALHLPHQRAASQQFRPPARD